MPLWRSGLSVAMIVLAAFAAYSNSFRVPEVLDDTASISENTYITRLWPITRAMKAPPQQTTAGRPVVSLSLAVSYAVSNLANGGRNGLDYRYYHGFNLAVHVLAALLLFGVVRETLLSERLKDRFAPHADWLAMICALLWVLHPLNTAAVTYMIQRAESMMGMFYLLTLYCSIRAFYSRRKAPWYVCAGAACGLGMGTKEVMVTAPLMVAIYDRVFLFPSFRKSAARRWPLYCALAATWAILGVLVASGPRSGSAGFGLGRITPLTYASAEFGVVMHYIRLAFWPAPLVLDYNWHVPHSALAVAVPAAVIALLLAGTVVALRRAPAAGFAGVWFFLILAPTSSILPIADLAFEHRMYLSLAGLIALLVLAGARAIDRAPAHARTARIAALVVVAAVAGALGWRTHDRNTTYRSKLSIYAHSLIYAPDSARVQNNLGYAYRHEGEDALAAGQSEEALAQKHRQDALDLERHDEALAQEHRAEAEKLQAAAREHYKQAEDYYRLALEHYNKALEADSRYAQAYLNRGVLYAYQGQFDKAIADFDSAIRLRPWESRPYYNRGTAYMSLGRYEEALSDMDATIKRNPNYAMGYVGRAKVLAWMGRLDEAIADCERALRVMPQMSFAQDTRRELLAMKARGGAPPPSEAQ
jgi:tetratricopeptide (TPR) repeat protein